MPIELRLPFRLTPGRYKILKQKLEDLERRTVGGVNIPGELFNSLVDGEGSAKITKANSTTLSAVWHAITIHCNSLNVPLTVFKTDSDGNSYPVTEEDRYQYKVHYALHTSPNLIMTPSMWIQLMETSRLIYGNGYSFINRNPIGEVLSFDWIHPDLVEVISNGRDLKYNIRAENSGGYNKTNVSSEDMLHVRNLSFNGVTGVGTIDQARESLEFGMNTQIAGNKFFKSGMRQAVVLTHPGGMKPESQTRLGDQFDTQMKSGKTIVLEEGIKPTTLTFSPEQSQFMTSREFSVTEVARWFNLPESMLENNARSTFSNIEHKTLWFLMNNVRPRARIYEQEFNRKLLDDDPNYYCSYNLNALLRADAVSRADFYVKMVTNGILLRNEVRELENLNKIEGGDEPLTPANMVTDKQREETMEGNGKATDKDLEAIESINN